jgi:hypothetical protein
MPTTAMALTFPLREASAEKCHLRLAELPHRRWPVANNWRIRCRQDSADAGLSRESVLFVGCDLSQPRVSDAL